MGLDLTTDKYPPITSQTRYPLRHAAIPTAPRRLLYVLTLVWLITIKISMNTRVLNTAFLWGDVSKTGDKSSSHWRFFWVKNLFWDSQFASVCEAISKFKFFQIQRISKKQIVSLLKRVTMVLTNKVKTNFRWLFFVILKQNVRRKVYL